MKTRLLLLAAPLLGTGGALTVTGSVTGGVTPETRVSGWAVTSSGQPVQEIVSVPVNAGGFRLEIPTPPPSARAQTGITSQNISWPGVLDPVMVSGPAQTAELKFFTYRDVNKNGQHDEGETLREVTPDAGRGSLFVVWVNTDVTVRANRGYAVDLKRGWNAFVVEVGKAIKVAPFIEGQVDVSVATGR
ncbi:hypothetical protein [Deinococcus hopiensis]|uniref:Carboxypeptidase regulatory-like domain-containing protein n=1 Tax=Deinococcus hopiensis KR-140 TaxID=695939 RepID=A0A1W1VHU8_9DEIO|nr:hypothetical protein [Deinococcus hopiensis]SMB92534.1 hypothetical protein SAMN00790413_01613 [Deinococcus hopiensis KR-140]